MISVAKCKHNSSGIRGRVVLVQRSACVLCRIEVTAVTARIPFCDPMQSPKLSFCETLQSLQLSFCESPQLSFCAGMQSPGRELFKFTHRHIMIFLVDDLRLSYVHS